MPIHPTQQPNTLDETTMQRLVSDIKELKEEIDADHGPQPSSFASFTDIIDDLLKRFSSREEVHGTKGEERDPILGSLLAAVAELGMLLESDSMVTKENIDSHFNGKIIPLIDGEEGNE